MHWVVDGNNVFGSRPDGWWNDRPAAQNRLIQTIAEWCRTHDDDVIVVFDAPLDGRAAQRAGGNLRVLEATRRGRDAADDEIVEIVAGIVAGWPPDERPLAACEQPHVIVVTSDRRLRSRLPANVGVDVGVHVEVVGAGRFLRLVSGESD